MPRWHAQPGAAGLAAVVEVRVGPALETLPRVAAEGRGPFDMIFLDADKEAYPDYLDWAVKLSRRGSLIVADNVVRQGGVVDQSNQLPDMAGIRQFNEKLARHPRLTATVIQSSATKATTDWLWPWSRSDFPPSGGGS